MAIDPKDMKVSEAVRKLNADFFSSFPNAVTQKPTLGHAAFHPYPDSVVKDSLTTGGGKTFRVPDVKPKKRLRQKTQGPNKLELEFEEFLRAEWADARVLAQAITFKLANGVRYTPDFVVVLENPKAVPALTLLAFETKGFMREDAAVKIKVAAAIYPWIRFCLVTKLKKKDGGGWDIQDVLP